MQPTIKDTITFFDHFIDSRLEKEYFKFSEDMKVFRHQYKKDVSLSQCNQTIKTEQETGFNHCRLFPYHLLIT